MVAISSSSSSPSRSSNTNPAASSSSSSSSNGGRYSSSPVSFSSSSPSHQGHQHGSNSRNSSSPFSSCRFLTFLSFLVVAQFLLLPITVHYYLSSSVLLEQQQALSPLQNDFVSMSRIRAVYSNNQLDSSFQQQQQQQQKKSDYDVNDYRDGTFNGAPLRLKTVMVEFSKQERNQQQQQQHHSPLLHSTRIHCVGENYNAETAWQQRSCEFQHLFCFNTSSQRFVVFQSQSERLLSDFLTQRVYDMHASSTLIRYKNIHIGGTMPIRPTVQSEQTMSIGGINQKWGNAGIQRLEWFPDIIQLSSSPSTQAAATAEVNSTTTSWQYYELPPSYIMIPYHSLNGANPGECVCVRMFE
jgi:hypothetical protein